MNTSTPFRIVRDAGEPLGLFFRPRKDDHKILQQLMSEGQIGMLGTILDPSHSTFQQELQFDVNQRSLDVIMETGMMELATPNGYRNPRSKLPWAKSVMHTPTDFDNTEIRRVAHEIARLSIANGFTAILAPTHFLAQGPADPWFQIDRNLVLALRETLDSKGGRGISIYYPLAIPGRLLTEAGVSTHLKAALSGLPIDSLWLRIHPFGSDSGDTSLRRYILACRDLHGLKIPIVAEKTGALGLALLAFGAIAGIESGIATGEKFDHGRLTRPLPPRDKFGKSARVYVSDLGLFLSRKEAETFFSLRGARKFACNNTQCCRRGYDSMIQDSRRHFACSRMNQVAQLSRVTPSLRPMTYLEDILRPASDNLGRALGHANLPDEIKRKLERHRRRQDGWRATLGELSKQHIPSFSAPVERRIHRLSATA